MKYKIRAMEYVEQKLPLGLLIFEEFVRHISLCVPLSHYVEVKDTQLVLRAFGYRDTSVLD